MTKVNLEEKFALFNELWTPKIVGRVDGCQVKLTRLLGEFVWHRHETEDEMFLVVRGEMKMHFRDRVETLVPGEFIIIPAGEEHMPSADRETLVMLFEPEGTLNTGNAGGSHTVAEPDWI